jgi:integrase/recombinase XerD
MALRDKRRIRQPIGINAQDPQHLYQRMLQFLEWHQVRNYSERTVTNWEYLLTDFLRWCDHRGIHSPREITQPILERYQRHLHQHRKTNGEALSARTQRTMLLPIKRFFSWLTRQHLLLSNPAAELVLPRLESRLPADVLSPSEVEAILTQPDIREPAGIRDRAMLEVLYSTGMRRAELAGLDIYSINAWPRSENVP